MESCVNELQYDQAREFGESALRMEPNNLKVLDALSSLLLEMADPASALEESSGADLNRALSSAYCAMAEIYMTDCCDEEDAEQQCSEFVQKSIQADPSNPEAFQAQANFLLVKQEHEAAKEAMQRSLDLWLPQHERLLLGEDAGNNDPVDVCPLSYSSRVNGVKVLIELEMLDVARKVRFDDADELAHIEELLAELGPEPEGEDEDEDKASFASESEEEEEAMEV
ncbi:hypothetical protein HPB52_017596 [Rhipicephalus sanguineus]|uniref:Uncharacterized protein n=1 Tax=Rhipicephalus sanguineus TaxID=34632 RepID=A0A9D4Q466_RHISA|nr:hypothetical protein HPB52_017596 [Rhipicephalus sanguineus]